MAAQFNAYTLLSFTQVGSYIYSPSQVGAFTLYTPAQGGAYTLFTCLSYCLCPILLLRLVPIP